MIASRRDLSVDVTVRRGSTNRSTLAPLATHRQGWLLCSEGARHANSTAVVTTLVSVIIWVIVFCCPLCSYDPQACEHLTPESLVPGGRPFALVRLLAPFARAPSPNIRGQLRSCSLTESRWFNDPDVGQACRGGSLAANGPC